MDELVDLRHANGERVARIYGPIDMDARGGTIALNLYNSRGDPIDHRRVEKKANTWKISLRTGCFCNPGAGEVAMGLERVDQKSTGAVRISFGIASTFEDGLQVLKFFQDFREA
jgi:selenocysteine lyase/cysteine desulfurase